ncbi:MAG: D-glycero-beta-D-manno-heptose 1-phosphate adenylyltransferase [Chloroflexi bacterium]|nr:D-glycero-beta-D-manno-heptose 1-phosphate adenylyltransferase [Chloroflexota bacterium]
MTLAEAQQLVAAARVTGKRIVLTNGVFDVLHAGHIRYLAEAKALGDLLIVGLNSDASVRALKGPTRPIVPESERAELLQALKPVNAVVRFEEPTARALVDALKPDVYVKGGDYSDHEPPEAPAVRAYGGEVRIVQLVEGRSSTDLIAAIRERFCP